MFSLAPGELARIRRFGRERKVAQDELLAAERPQQAAERNATEELFTSTTPVEEAASPGAAPAAVATTAAAVPIFSEGDILLLDVVLGPLSAAAAIFDACGTASICMLRLTCTTLAKLALLLRRRDELMCLPRESGVARLFVLHNERASEQEADHYGEWRAGWEPSQAGEEEQERCTFVHVAQRLYEMSSDDEGEDDEAMEAGPGIGGNTGDGMGLPMGYLGSKALVVRDLATFAKWRGCDVGHLKNLRHLDLVLDEGQYRGSGTFLAQWIPDGEAGSVGLADFQTGKQAGGGGSSRAWGGDRAAAAARTGGAGAGRMVLVPAQGLDGSMLPAAALPAVAIHGGAYYQRAGYHSAVFVEADLNPAAAAMPGISGTKSALQMKSAMAWWRRCQPGTEYRLFCDIRHAHKLLCPRQEREEIPLANLRWEPLEPREREQENGRGEESPPPSVVAAQWEQWLPPSVVVESLEDERTRLQRSIAGARSSSAAAPHTAAGSELDTGAMMEELENLTWMMAELAATPASSLPGSAGSRRELDASRASEAASSQVRLHLLAERARGSLPASDVGVGYSCHSPKTFTQRALSRDPTLRELRSSGWVAHGIDARQSPDPLSGGGSGDVMTPRLGFHWQNNGVGSLQNNRGTTPGPLLAI